MSIKIKKLSDLDYKINKEDKAFKYQEKLTEKLDRNKINFDQNIINEIVLWKVNRYAQLGFETLSLINEIKIEDRVFSKDLTSKILTKLLNEKGVGLAMASTILRFKNPKIYQIIDQRVYRSLHGKELSLPAKSKQNIKCLIDLYLNYLDELRQACNKYKIDFESSDRIIYNADKRINKDLKIRY